MVIAINEDVLQTQVMQIEAELFGLSAGVLYESHQSLHHALPSVHLFSNTLLPLVQMSDQEGAPLMTSVVTIHSITGSIPLFLALLDIPFVTVIATIVRNGLQVMMPRGLDLVRVEMQAVWSGLTLVLTDDTSSLALNAGLKVRLSAGPWTKVDFRWVNEITSIRTEERPGDDRTNMKLSG